MKKIEDKVTKTHVYFWGDPTLSNWGPAEFEHKGEKFRNSEQAFMWEKAIFFKDDIIARKILTHDNPSLVKDLGRKVQNFDNDVWAYKDIHQCYKFVWLSLTKMKNKEKYSWVQGIEFS